MSTIRRRYSDTGYGRIHLRVLEAANRDESTRPLVCLHPSPYSGLYFTTVMPLLNERRTVVAPDYPGYGGSDSAGEMPTISDYANALLEALSDAGFDTPCDLLGFHTGCLVGVEMRRLAPERVDHLLLCDVPYFSSDAQAGLREKMGQPLPLTGELECLSGAWDFDVKSRLDAAGLNRSVELFVEHLRALPNDQLGFLAAFSYDCERHFTDISGRTTVIATESGLKEPTRAAADAIEAAAFVGADDIKGAVFESGAERIAQYVIDSLDKQP